MPSVASTDSLGHFLTGESPQMPSTPNVDGDLSFSVRNQLFFFMNLMIAIVLFISRNHVLSLRWAPRRSSRLLSWSRCLRRHRCRLRGRAPRSSRRRPWWGRSCCGSSTSWRRTRRSTRGRNSSNSWTRKSRDCCKKKRIQMKTTSRCCKWKKIILLASKLVFKNCETKICVLWC